MGLIIQLNGICVETKSFSMSNSRSLTHCIVREPTHIVIYSAILTTKHGSMGPPIIGSSRLNAGTTETHREKTAVMIRALTGSKGGIVICTQCV